MLDADEVPFNPSEHAYRTNFDGLAIAEKDLEPHLEKAKKAYENALKIFASQDSEARDNYKSDKDEGLTSSSFKDWVSQNAPQWGQWKAQLQSCGDNLTQVGRHAFGQPYQDKLDKDQRAFVDASHRAGHWPATF